MIFNFKKETNFFLNSIKNDVEILKRRVEFLERELLKVKEKKDVNNGIKSRI
jgi:hypothetical protein